MHIKLLLVVLCALIMLPAFSYADAEQVGALLAGMELYRGGKYPEALAAFQKAEAASPVDADIPFYLGLTTLQLNNPDAAADYFRKTIAKDPQYTDAYFQLGVIDVQKKAYNDAVADFEKVYAKEPEREDLGYFLGFAYYQLGQYEKALSVLAKAKTSDQGIGSLTLYYTGLSQQQLGMDSEAMTSYKQLIIADPTSPLREPAQRLVEAMTPEERAKKPFSIEVTAKLQYDDNVILVPTTDVFNLSAKDRKSWVEQIYLKGEYTFLSGAARAENATSQKITTRSKMSKTEKSETPGYRTWGFSAFLYSLVKVGHILIRTTTFPELPTTGSPHMKKLLSGRGPSLPSVSKDWTSGMTKTTALT